MRFSSRIVWLAALAACQVRDTSAAPREAELVVFAAASLRDVFGALQVEFERAHPGVELTFNFAGSQALRTQLEQGAAADVFASADRAHMQELRRAERVTAPVVFAHNQLVVVVADEAAHAIRSLADLPHATSLVVAAEAVPVGRYALQMLERARASLGSDFRSRVEARVVSRELNVRQVLAKVSLGEAQAGIVYRTDALAAPGRVHVVPIPPEADVTADYPVAVVNGAPHPDLARAWVRFLVSPEGQRVLQQAGFVAAGLDPSAS